jgi:hypothetical protein
MTYPGCVGLITQHVQPHLLLVGIALPARQPRRKVMRHYPARHRVVPRADKLGIRPERDR